jgi:hypothetical protein
LGLGWGDLLGAQQFPNLPQNLFLAEIFILHVSFAVLSKHMSEPTFNFHATMHITPTTITIWTTGQDWEGKGALGNIHLDEIHFSTKLGFEHNLTHYL